MKRLFSCPLFQTRPTEGASPSRRVGFWLWNILLLTAGAVGLGLLSLVLAPAQFGWDLFWDYLDHPALLALNLLPPVVLTALLYGAVGRAWLAYAVTALPVLGLSFGNYYKLAFRDDPVVAADVLLLGEAGNMAGKYQLYFTTKLIAVLVCALLGGVVLALFVRGRPKGRIRAITAGAALVCALALIPVYGSDELYENNVNEEHINKWASTQRYVSRGLIYPFLHSVKDALPNPPKGYSQKESAAWLAEYEDADIPEDKKVNIVGVMLEAFADFSCYGQIEFNQDVYANYHALEAESYTGSLLTNIFAGGTINTERAFLTGVGIGDHDYRSDTSSYVWYLKDQGYRTTGSHPSYSWFYNRENINSYLGFDDYHFGDSRYEGLTEEIVTSDRYFFSDLTASVLEQVQEDAPLFSFSVTYQGHGPYSDTECIWGDVDDYIANYELDPAERCILANYFGSVMDTQVHFMEMVDTFRDLEEPIVLVVFGDHKPWLGNNSTVYNDLGIDLLGGTKETLYNYWSTRYLIWANDAAKEALGTDMVGEGPDISPCFLMNVLFDQLGWAGDAYMQAMAPCLAELPMVHNFEAYLTSDGQLLREVSGQQAELVRRFQSLGYDRAHHFDK